MSDSNSYNFQRLYRFSTEDFILKNFNPQLHAFTSLLVACKAVKEATNANSGNSVHISLRSSDNSSLVYDVYPNFSAKKNTTKSMRRIQVIFQVLSKNDDIVIGVNAGILNPSDYAIIKRFVDSVMTDERIAPRVEITKEETTVLVNNGSSFHVRGGSIAVAVIFIIVFIIAWLITS